MLIATLKPDIYFIGGDIAYDDNMPACAYTWDYYLRLYESLTTSIGHLMPIVLTVGNHDVGLNEMPGVNITINEFGPAYLIYFPQHYDRTPNGEIIKAIPPVARRKTYFYHTFANMHYISLDSGYVNTFHGYSHCNAALSRSSLSTAYDSQETGAALSTTTSPCIAAAPISTLTLRHSSTDCSTGSPSSTSTKS